MLVLDLCAGTGSATQAFVDRGHDVDTLDVVGGHTFNMDVRKFKPWKKYNFIWASPPCTCFSVASLRYHWPLGIPNSETIEAIEIVKACFEICSAAPFWMIENPMGMFRIIVAEMRKKYYLSTVTYCQYGDTAMKPTDLLHNIDSFHPLRCSNGSKCHVSSPRHSHEPGSTQGKKYNNRSKIPYGLSLAICKALERELDNPIPF